MCRLVVALSITGLVVALGPVVAAAGPTGGLEAFCQARVDIEKAFTEAPFGEGEPDPDEVEEFQNELFPLLDTFDQYAPPELAAQVATVTGALRQAAETGEDPFEDTAVQEAGQAINAYVIANCGFEVVDVTAIEYEFLGVPRTVKAGTVAFNLTTEGAEVHELIVFRIKGDESIKEILDLPEKKQDKKVQFMGAVFAPQGVTDATILELKPGRYGVICFVAVGTTDPNAEPEDEDAKTHAEEGMYKGFKVKK